jgi:hypothetical protein
MKNQKPETRLINLPKRIAALELKQHELQTELKKFFKDRDKVLLPIDKQIAFDKECKNKEQRDVMRSELLSGNEEYQYLLELIEAKEIELANLSIKIKQLERQFSVEKLVCRWALAFQYSTVSQLFEIDETTIHNGSEHV